MQIIALRSLQGSWVLKSVVARILSNLVAEAVSRSERPIKALSFSYVPGMTRVFEDLLFGNSSVLNILMLQRLSYKTSDSQSVAEYA